MNPSVGFPFCPAASQHPTPYPHLEGELRWEQIRYCITSSPPYNEFMLTSMSHTRPCTAQHLRKRENNRYFRFPQMLRTAGRCKCD